jgi:signal transduction histidine kinase
MKTKVKLSISLKLTLIVILVSAIAILSIAVINTSMEEEQKHFLEVQYDKSAALIHALNSSIASSKTLENQTKSIAIINNFQKWNEHIIEVNINLADEQDKLIVFASTNTDLINSSSNSYLVEGTNYSNLCYSMGNTYYIPLIKQKPRVLVILSPINLSGEIYGTYEIISSLEATFAYIDSVQDSKTRNVLFTSFLVLFLILFCFLFLLRKVIVKPIIRFRDTAKIFGKGDLDARVEIKSKDELGDLAQAFNQMAKDLKESRDKIQDYNQILENLLQQKDEFIGQLGHDLKNPLQPLIGLLPILIEQEDDPEKKETLKLMNQNAEYMRELIFKTLQLAKLRSSKIEFDFEKLNLKSEVDTVISTEKIILKEKNIELENKVNENINVIADRLRLAEVLKNLISNAAKYTQSNSGKIIVDAKKQGKKVTVSIKDTGIGMSKEQIKKLFDEFYKVNVSTSEYHSTGLGLAICKRIIEKHEGKIWVESEGLGRGSTFYFTLKSADEK